MVIGPFQRLKPSLNSVGSLGESLRQSPTLFHLRNQGWGSVSRLVLEVKDREQVEATIKAQSLHYKTHDRFCN